MATSPITGVPLPASTATDQVPADLMTAIVAAEKFFVGQFTSATDRDTKIPSPVNGMTCWLNSPGCFSERVSGAWKNRYPNGVKWFNMGWPSSLVSGSQNISTNTTTINPGVGPYLLRVSVGVMITAVGGAIPQLQMFVNGTVRALHNFSSISTSNQNLSGNLSREFYIADGSSTAVYARVDIPAGTNVQTYTDDTHSFVSMSVTPV